MLSGSSRPHAARQLPWSRSCTAAAAAKDPSDTQPRSGPRSQQERPKSPVTTEDRFQTGFPRCGASLPDPRLWEAGGGGGAGGGRSRNSQLQGRAGEVADPAAPTPRRHSLQNAVRRRGHDPAAGQLQSPVAGRVVHYQSSST